MPTRYDRIMKFLIVGETYVGKTCVLTRFANDSFNSAFISTIGIDFRIKTVELQNRIVKLEIWEINDNWRFHDYVASHYQGAMGVFLIYDITNVVSFLNVSHWFQAVKKFAGTDTRKILLGNKCDLKEERKISKVQGENLAKENNAKFFEVSARMDTNIKHAFITLANDVLGRIAEDSTPPKITITSNIGKNSNMFVVQ